jgi:hypothetical protein
VFSVLSAVGLRKDILGPDGKPWAEQSVLSWVGG